MRCIIVVGMLAWAVTHGWGAETAAAAQPLPPDAEAADRNPQEMEKSLTVFPVVIRPEPGVVHDFARRVAAVVALAIERAGVEDVRLAEAAFHAPATDQLDQLAATFAQQIRQQPIETNYALYAEIVGAPKTWPQQIRTILIDKQGQVILCERDDPKTYAQTSSLKPADPMSCSIFIARKVQKLWGLQDPLRPEAPQGKMAAYWRKQSGLPPKEELQAIAKRFEKMRQRLDTATFAVCPVRVGSRSDRQAAVELVAMLNQQQICRVVVSDAEPKLQIQGDPNEQKVLWDTARAFRRWVRQNPPKADYAVLADYAIGRSASGQQKVGYVHTIVCDKEGQWVAVDFQNSHHEDFQAVKPQSIQDCHRLIIRRARAGLMGQ